MKQNETEFLKALGGIPQPYIDELIQFQAEHAQAPEKAWNAPKQRSDEQRKENHIMMHSAQHADASNRQADISVRKLRPFTIGILASLSACAVLAVGFCVSHFRNNDIAMTPATAPEQSEMPVIEETEAAPEESSAAPDPAACILGEYMTVFTTLGDNSETSGIPEIPENGGMLFTSMEDLLPLLERASATDLPVKGVQHAESCFHNGQHILILKAKWISGGFDSTVRSIYLTADGYLHADVASYVNDNENTAQDYSAVTHCYLLAAVPESLNEISGASVRQTLYCSDCADSETDDPFKAELIAYNSDTMYVKQLAHNEADYIFPEFTFEMYAPDEDMDDDSAWMLGDVLVNMRGAGLPEPIAADALEIIEPNLTQLHENALVGMNNVQSGAAPYISVYDTADGTARRLVYPEQKYHGCLNGGMRVTILSSSALSDTAQMQAPFEEPSEIESALPHTDGHASFLTIVNNP